MTKRFGFTLAEVLITLGIIGVVAAMTMPTLINQTNGAQYKAAYKKALSALSQAVTLNVALDDESFADTIAGTAGSVAAGGTNAEGTAVTGTTVASLLNSRMNIVNYNEDGGKIDGTKDYDYQDLNDVADEKALTKSDLDTFLFFNDGSMFAFNSTSAACTEDATSANLCEGIIDVNGLKGPNKVVKCDAGTYTAGKAPSTEGGTDGVAADTSNCAVKSPTDVYPVYFYDQTVVPKSAAAKAVLYGK